MHLRPYQQSAVDAVRADWERGINDSLLVAATGAGKTQMFLKLLMDQLDADSDFDSPVRGLILAHRQELIYQPLERIEQIDPQWLWRNSDLRPRVGVMMAERNDADAQLTVATVQTLASPKRLARLLRSGAIDYLVVDECHHATSPSYVKILSELRAANPMLKHLGVTATPMRADEDGLAKVYSHVSYKVTIADLVKQGYLVQPRWLAIGTGISLDGVHTRSGDYVASELADKFDTPAGRKLITEAWLQYAKGRRAIAFTSSVKGAHDLADAFTALGVSAAAIDGTTPTEERKRILADYKAGKIQVLANCQVLTEGFDAPGTSCILMCRPTKSDSLYIQCMGRGLRPALGKAQPGEDCLILDFVPADTRNIVMAGDVLGLPKEIVRAALKETATEEPGMVQAGFTFDGEHFDSNGTPMEIIARQLDYLNTSPFTWYRRSGWLTLGLGKCSDGAERILAIVPGSRYRLYGIHRRKDEESGKWQPWKYWALAGSESLEEVGEAGNEVAGRWGSGTIASKGRSWQAESASDNQLQYLRRLARGDLKPREIEQLSKLEAAQLITFYQAQQVLAFEAQQVAA